MSRRRPLRGRGERLSKPAAGAIALVLTACLTYLGFSRDVPLVGDPWEIQAVVASSNELGQRSPVRIAGVDVGRVVRTRRGPGGTAVITMAIDERALPLHEDAELRIRPRLFLEGNFFVDLRPGTPSAPVMEEGHTIPLASTAIPVQLDEILAALQSDTRRNLRALVRGLRVALDQDGAASLRRSFPFWSPAFRRAAQSLEAVRGERAGDLPGFVDSGGRTTAALARDERALAELVTGLNRTARALAVRRVELAASVRGIDAVLAETRPTLRSLNRTFPALRAFVRDARPGLRVAPATLRLAAPLLVQLRSLVARRELPALLRELRPSVASLGRLRPRLVELLGLLTPVTECLRRNALPTLKKPVDDPPLTTGAPVYRELLYSWVGLSSGSQNFDGNGPAVRYLAGLGDQLVTTGHVPSANEPLVGLTSEPILGSRPRYDGTAPPFRPDVPCVSQQPPSLAAETGPAPLQQKVAPRQQKVAPLP